MMHSAKSYDGKIAGLYDLEETLGSGHFAVVKLARHVFTGEKVAVKVIDKNKLDQVSMSHLFQEVRCMKLVQHPNVVRLYEVIDTQTKLYLILELGDGGDLYDYIMKHEGGLGEDMAREYFRQIVRAISYCHQLHVVHRDLKPENVVFFERLGVVKLTDFGFSNKFNPGQKLETSCGSLAYCAPEILLGDSYDAPAVDVWSLGVILYMLVVGQAPFREANDSETLTMIMDCKYSVPDYVSEKCQKLIARMLVREPAARATLEDIATDTWLGGGPVDEYLSLVNHQQLTEEEKNVIINKMVAGTIATKEEITDALERNDYNHVTATYFLLAERKLRAHRQEAGARGGPPIPVSVSSHSFSTPSESGKEGAKGTLTELAVPEATTGRVRKCSIVQEEDDEEEYRSQELTPGHSNFNRRGSRSEGKLNVAMQERIADERRGGDGSGSPHPLVPVTRVDVRDDSGCWSARRSPTTSHTAASKWRSARQSSRSDSDESSGHVTELAHTTLSEAATMPLPVTAPVTPEPTRFRTLPSPTRAGTARLNEISEEGVLDFAPRLSLYEQRRNKFHKTRTASCSSSDASDDDSESRKKRAAKISSDRARRDSHDDSSDSQDPGGNGGGGAGGTSGGNEGGASGDREQQPPPRPQPPSGGAPTPPPAGRPHRARRRTADTRLRESQSLNRITEVQEPQVDPVLERLAQDAKPGKGLGARLLQSWTRRQPHWHKAPDEEKENRGKKMKLLGRYFQVSKKLCIPLPSLVSKGRLYKARSCGAIARDRVVSDPNARPPEPTADNYVYLKRCKSPACPKAKTKGPTEVVLSAIGGAGTKGKSKGNSEVVLSVLGAKGKGKVIEGQLKAHAPCPRQGVCTTHMQDAAKCHLS